MKLKFNFKKLSNKETKLISENQKIYEQLKNYIQEDAKGAYMISGYRGVGKSEISKMFETDTDDSNIICIPVNCASYQTYSNLLRKMIRATYQTLIDSNIYKKKAKLLTPLKEDLEKIYIQTFHEMKEQTQMGMEKEYRLLSEMTWNLKRMLLFFIVTILFFVILIFGENNLWYQMISSATLILFYVISSYSKIFQKEEHLSKNYLIKTESLYDDEIADYYLRKILKEFSEYGLHVVLIFDEIDKIESPKKLNQLMTDLKPLLLSKTANFIVISGQLMYEQYKLCEKETDSIWNGIFSKVFYVSVASYSFFYELLKNSIDGTLDKNTNELLENYTKLCILKSDWVIRKFLVYILQDGTYDGKNLTISVSKEKEKEWKYAKDLYQVGIQIRDEYLNDLPIDDRTFYLQHLFLWLKKIYEYGRYTYQKEYVTNKSKELNRNGPQRQLTLVTLENALFSVLEEQRLVVPIEGEENAYQNTYLEGNALEETEEEKTFLSRMIHVERYVELLDKNKAEELITNQEWDIYRIYQQIRNRLIHYGFINELEKLEIRNFEQNIHSLNEKLLTNILYTNLNAVLTPYQFQYKDMNHKNSICIADLNFISQLKKYKNILLDINYAYELNETSLEKSKLFGIAETLHQGEQFKIICYHHFDGNNKLLDDVLKNHVICIQEDELFSKEKWQQIKKYMISLVDKYPEQFYYSSRDKRWSAKGIYYGGEMMVLKGSVGVLSSSTSFPQKKSILEEQKRLIEQEIIEVQDDKVIFVKDCLFSSSSHAAKFICLFSINGRDVWKTKKGKTLNQIYLEKEENEIFSRHVKTLNYFSDQNELNHIIKNQLITGHLDNKKNNIINEIKNK